MDNILSGLPMGHSIRDVMIANDAKKLNKTKSPLEALYLIITKFFRDGFDRALVKFLALDQAILKNETRVEWSTVRSLLTTGFIIPNAPCNLCKLATTLVLVLATPKDKEKTTAALKWMSSSPEGFSTMASVTANPSADLPARSARAKQAAFNGKIPKTTVLGVRLIDVELLERGGKRGDFRLFDHFSFAHSFVIGIDCEGFRVFQAWGEHGYTLDEYLERNGARLRDWKEAKLFLKNFQKLTTHEFGMKRETRHTSIASK